LPHSQTLAGGKETCLKTLCSDTEIGLFGIAMRMLELLVVVPMYFMNSVLPVMTRLLEEGGNKVKALMQYSFDFMLTLSLPLMIGGIIFARPIVSFISGPEFLGGNLYRYGSDEAIQILMFAMFFSFLNTLFGFTLVILNKQTRLLVINAVAVVFNLAGNFWLIPHFGFRGAAWVSVFSEFIILVLAYLAVQKKLGFHMSFAPFFKMLFSSATMGILVALGYRFLPHSSAYLQLGILVPMGGIIYVFLMFKTKAITPEMLALLRRREPVAAEAPLPSGQDF
jgi:O-antigen/teichoic acid export membrane protein